METPSWSWKRAAVVAALAVLAFAVAAWASLTSGDPLADEHRVSVPVQLGVGVLFLAFSASRARQRDNSHLAMGLGVLTLLAIFALPIMALFTIEPGPPLDASDQRGFVQDGERLRHRRLTMSFDALPASYEPARDLGRAFESDPNMSAWGWRDTATGDQFMLTLASVPEKPNAASIRALTRGSFRGMANVARETGTPIVDLGGTHGRRNGRLGNAEFAVRVMGFEQDGRHYVAVVNVTGRDRLLVDRLADSFRAGSR